ncbi:MAG: hypothetical protein HOL56_05600 [Flavobacteriales bacterium]|nr:hypothetical protein [Flavobacteriales bacterium]
MSAELLVWGIYHEGNGGYNTSIFESQITPIDVQNTLSDLREDKIIKEDSSRFYSVSLSAHHRIYTIYTYSKDHEHRNGFTAISIYTNKDRVLSNIFESLNKAIELYLGKKDSTYPNIFDNILDNIEEFQNYNSDVDKSSGTSCYYGTGENSIKYFLNNSNTQQYQKVYATYDNEKIKEKYSPYTKPKKDEPIKIPLNSKSIKKKTYMYAGGSIAMIVFLIWFISTLFPSKNDPPRTRYIDNNIKQTEEKNILTEKFGEYIIKMNLIDNNNKEYYWARNTETVERPTEKILLIKKYKEKLKEFPSVLDNLKSNIQIELISENGIKILLYKNNKVQDFPENLERMQELEGELIPKKIRYFKGTFEVKKKDKWDEASNLSLYEDKIFKYYLKGIDNLINIPETTIQDLEEDNEENNKEDIQNNSTNNNSTTNNKTPDINNPNNSKCIKHDKVDVEDLENNLARDDIEGSEKIIDEKLKKLGNCPKCDKTKGDLKAMRRDLKE